MGGGKRVGGGDEGRLGGRGIDGRKIWREGGVCLGSLDVRTHFYIDDKGGVFIFLGRQGSIYCIPGQQHWSGESVCGVSFLSAVSPSAM